LDRIKEEEEILIGLTDTFGELRGFATALSKRVGNSSFVITNALVWNAMIAKRDLFTIHFASWIRGLAEGGGFFGQLRAHHIRDLRRAWDETFKPFKPSGDVEKDALHKIISDHRRKRLEERFPAAIARGEIDPEDVEGLKDAIWKKLEPVVQDRDSFRAHPHDGQAKADARMLGLDELQPLLLAAQQMMNDLRSAANFSTFGYPPVDAGSTTEAEDLVDLILFHDVLNMTTLAVANDLLNQHAGVYWWQLREEFLEELRRAHTARPDLPINALELVDVAEDTLRSRHSLPPMTRPAR
jgi:hypothetical protein